MNLVVISQNSLLISLLRTVLNNTKVQIEVLKNPISYNTLHLPPSSSREAALIIDTQLLDEAAAQRWMDFAKISKNPILLVNTEYQTPEDIISVQKSILYLSNPLLSLGNLDAIKEHEENHSEKHALDLYLDTDVIFDISNLCVLKKGEKIPLTNLEAKILLFLYKNLNQIIETNILMEKAELSNSASLYVHIKNLRNKIEKNPQSPAILKTARKKGYILSIKP
ncbi:winged helix-turn-helix domain-containing protein [Ectobacillus sp. JY-23]|uniref:winged helix-turn-helix domain-containing protein n=1 Tax=Ectobacillus sp. JY-23 TaxID=2933872 RepID=UPI001FF5ED5B|nr:winged helix-turn-helix domain-containing protein [Ectobacillus sp. JY-23]UOY91138.1 winged helix-turn-helix domain-containing protein [Ectobacillus sp. JY-23]